MSVTHTETLASSSNNSAFPISKTAWIASHNGVRYTFTAGENIGAYQLVYVKSDGKIWKSQANAVGTMPADGMTLGAVSTNATVDIMLLGVVTNAGWAFTPGVLLYQSAATAGLITSTAPAASTNIVQIVGKAITATSIMLYPNMGTLTLS
jgi:hypothetical protein